MAAIPETVALGQLIDSLNTNSIAAPKEEKDQLSAVLDALGESSEKIEKFLVDNFSFLEKHTEYYRKELEDILETYFPGRWEIQDNPIPEDRLRDLKDWINKAVFKDREDPKKFMEELVRNNNYTRSHGLSKKLVLIHFPEIKIVNSRKQTHTIKNLWMRFHYNYIYRLLNMGGARSTKTFSEHESNYNHSHMNCSNASRSDEWLGCCLGGTDYSTLNSALHANFDVNNTTLFFQQLTDYLSWESIEGGPYMRMEDIGNRNYNTRQSYMSGNDVNTAYNNFLIKFPSGYNIQLEDNGIFYNFKVIKDEEFKKKVAEVCPEQFLQLYDTINKRQFVENNSNNTSTINRIRELNRSYRNNPSYRLFKFKGEDIYFQIEDPSAGTQEVVNPTIIRMAPQNLIDQIAQKLEQNINAFYTQQFIKEFTTNK